MTFSQLAGFGLAFVLVCLGVAIVLAAWGSVKNK